MLNPYYLDAFAEFKTAGGARAPKWNWAAFLFGFFWYFSKGMTKKAIWLLVITAASGMLATPFLAIHTGRYGTWDYYSHLQSTGGA